MAIKINQFLTLQLKQLQEGGWPEWKRKLNLVFMFFVKLPVLILMFIPALSLIMLARLIRPVFLIRFQKMISWRIGHFAGNTELYLCELDAGINKPETRFVDIWYCQTAPCNYQLARMWKRVLHIGPAFLFGLVDRINSMIPGGELHRIGNNTDHDRDMFNLLDRFPPHLSFQPEEEKRGEAGLRDMGILDGAPFVCLAVRDSAYLNDQSPHLDWSRHNHRDSNIQDFAQTAKKLVDRGYYVLRMGSVVKEAMNVDHPMIIDYATNGMRSDFMDIYLGAKCTFCVSTSLGFDAIPTIFRRPVVFIDVSPLGIIRTNTRNYISTAKKYWLRDEKRLMSFQEIFESGASGFWLSNEYEAMGIDLIASTPEEIAAVVLEMEDRLTGNWKSNDEDERLQQRFWELFPMNEYNGEHSEIRSRIGADFLRQHKDWVLPNKQKSSEE